MKKSLTLAILAAAATMVAWAEPVSQQRATDLALKFVKQQQWVPADLKINGVEKVGETYIVNFSPASFVIVSADDNATPVIGYSEDSNLYSYQMPDNMRFIMDQASDIIKLEAFHGSFNPKWTSITTGQVARSRAGEEVVKPLISVKFNQSSPYNKYCPGTGGDKAIVGCVAVAMSQAMSVQRYPAKPQGNKTYIAASYGQISIDYDHEAPYNWDAIITGSDGKSEAARLLYHAGVSVEMDYGPDGSGIPSSQVSRISKALVNHFGYGPDVKYTWRKDYRGDWTQFLLNELYAGNAVVYNAVDSSPNGGGHSFNIDGYDGSMFHVNWGWGGYGNGYFSIDDLSDATMKMNYDTMHVAVTGIGNVNSQLHGVYIPDASVEENQPAGTIVSAVLVNGELPSSNMKVDITGAYEMSIDGYLKVPFAYKDGLIVTTREISQPEGPIYVRVVVTVDNGTNIETRVAGANIEVEKPQTLEHKTSVSYDRAGKKFTVHTRYTTRYTLKDAQGNVIMQGRVGNIPEFSFSREQLSAGANVLELSTDKQSATVKIVK